MPSMELSEEQSYDAQTPIPMAYKPDYPYGLRICLTEVELAKLCLDTECKVGDVLHFECFARVTSVSQNETADGMTARVELQIEDAECL